MEIHPYRKIAEHFRCLIHAGTLQPGDQLPTVRAIACLWKVNRTTAQKAMAVLRHEGLVETDGRHGTCVKPHAEQVILVPLSTPKATIAATELLHAPAALAYELGVPDGHPVLVVRVLTPAD